MNPTNLVDNNNPLSQLKDIHLPDPIGWWPLAFSWWVLIFSLSAIVFALVWFLLDRHKRNAYRREALKQMNAIQADDNSEVSERILQINALLKQVAITVYGRQEVAKLNQQAWLDFLHETANFVRQPTNAIEILELSYQGKGHKTDAELNELLLAWQNYAQQWIKGHHL
ncbi:DUF4381 domain-containing protein [Thiomicrorhabdus sp. ZW0627]|uniref:DUF4381 domain-containing protein n=1 Tax=Thiomicrorhabdus sp. ZW0627 TaxID=3039774 RepID=UPI002436569D|nr:DUF4381 domain-containing protein [Thiomicrorhabdus sp. ZW0627]MDG6774207.1 DUF4381 domain-containing protein [Thiomicrorhabdus sp. ZW0627]